MTRLELLAMEQISKHINKSTEILANPKLGIDLSTRSPTFSGALEEKEALIRNELKLAMEWLEAVRRSTNNP